MYSGLEQFETFSILTKDISTKHMWIKTLLFFNGFPFSFWEFSNLISSFFTIVVISFSFLTLVYYTIKKKPNLISLQKIGIIKYFLFYTEHFFWLLKKANINPKFFEYYNIFFSIFLIILASNLLGMVPFTYTNTSHFLFTFTIAISSFCFLNYIGIRKNGLLFLNLFLPNGTPFPIIPFLILIEIISYIARVFSLPIRLFANLMSGHTLLKILSGFSWIIVSSNTCGLLIGIIPLLIIFLVNGLEFAIAFLQAYVFLILLLIYFNDATTLSH